MKPRISPQSLLLRSLPVLFPLLMAGWIFSSMLGSSAILMKTDDNIGVISTVHNMLPQAFLRAWHDGPLLGVPARMLSLSWSHLLLWLLPPEIYTNWFQAISLALASCFLYAFLRRKRLGPAAALLAALTAFWMGSNLTLTYAGHDKKFAILTLAAASLYAVSFIRRKRWLLPGALFGSLAGMMFCEQQDVALFFALPLGAYYLFSLLRLRLPLATTLAACAIAGGLAGLVAANALLSGYLGAVKDVAAIEQSPREKWYFATQWSWPPEETIAFIAPGYTGWRSGEPDGPYWGRMGRSPDWEKTGQGFMNFKLENTYLGLIPVIFALYAFCMAWKRRRETPDTGPDGATTGQRPEILFWSAAALLTLLLAFGRYFPLYALFFRLPMVGNIRNPNKFLQVFQVAFAILAAYGLQALIDTSRNQSSSTAHRLSLRFIGACCALLGIWFLARLAFSADVAKLTGTGWSAAAATVISGNKTRAIGHAFLMAAAIFGTFWIMLRLRITEGVRATLAGLLLLIVAADAKWLSRHYIKTMPPSWIESNAVVDAIRQHRGTGRVASIRQDSFYNVWFTYLFPYHDIPAFNVMQMPRMPTNYERLLATFQRDLNGVLRMWQLSGVALVFLPGDLYRQMSAQPAASALLSPLLAFDIQPGLQDNFYVRPAPQGSQVLAALAPQQAGRYTLIAGSRRFQSPDEALAWLANPATRPLQQVALTGAAAPELDGAGQIGTIDMLHYSSARINLRVHAPQPAILRCADRYDPDWQATLNGEPIPVLQADFCMMGLHIPAGTHDVELLYNPGRTLLLPQLAGFSLLALVCLQSLLSALHRKTAARIISHPSSNQESKP